MIHAPTLLKDLQRLLKTLEADLRARLEEQAELDHRLKAEWQAACAADRTGESYETWREEAIIQAGVHWLLACVFLRFIEDNGLIERPYLSGAGERLALARDRHESYFRAHPLHSDREYLIACFREVEALPGMGAIFDERHNPVFRIGLSGDAAMALLGFWQKVSPDSGRLVHEFIDPEWSTRFLGDLYQDLSESARKRYALLQTPEFVEEFILDSHPHPGHPRVRLPRGAAHRPHLRLGTLPARRLPAAVRRLGPQRACPQRPRHRAESIGWHLRRGPQPLRRGHRPLPSAGRGAQGLRRDAAQGRTRLPINVATGDSLLHGRRFRELDLDRRAPRPGAPGRLRHAYTTEDLDELNRILGQQYHAVVGNPPYITVKDAALNQALPGALFELSPEVLAGRALHAALLRAGPAPLPPCGGGQGCAG